MRMHKSKRINDVLEVVARLRGPGGCPWDRKQTHRSIWAHLLEEVYELLDAIESRHDELMIEELGDILLHVVFHCQLARERHAFDFDDVCARLVEKLVRRHPHVFGRVKVAHVDEVLHNWEKIKMREKKGKPDERRSVFDGLPWHLPALMYAQKLIKKARRAGIEVGSGAAHGNLGRRELAARLFELVAYAQARGWDAEGLLRSEARRRETELRRAEPRNAPAAQRRTASPGARKPKKAKNTKP